MDDKSFELLTKMYAEMIKGFDNVKNELNNVKIELDKKADKSDIARLEYELKTHIDALYDGYKQNYESIQEIKAAK